MSSFLFPSRYMPCPECGASVDRTGADAHVCDDDRRLDYELFQLRDETAAFEVELHAYLDSPHGRFQAWDAERRRPRPPSP